MYTIVYETYLEYERQKQYEEIALEGKIGDIVNKAKEGLKKFITVIKEVIIEFGRRLKFADRYYLSEQDYEILKFLYKHFDSLFILVKNIENVGETFDEEKIRSMYEKASNARAYMNSQISEIKNKYSSKVDKDKRFAVGKNELKYLSEDLAKMCRKLVDISKMDIEFPVYQKDRIYGMALMEIARVCAQFSNECSYMIRRSKTGSLFTDHKNDKNPKEHANESYINLIEVSTSDYIAMENFLDLNSSFKKYKLEMKELNKKIKETQKKYKRDKDNPEAIKEQIKSINETTAILKKIRTEIADTPENKLSVYLYNTLGGFLRSALSMSGIIELLTDFYSVPTNILRALAIIGIALPVGGTLTYTIIRDKKNDFEPQSNFKKNMLGKIDKAISINEYTAEELRSRI